MFSNSYAKWRLLYMMLHFVAVTKIASIFLGNLCPRSEDGVAGSRPKSVEARRGQDGVREVTAKVNFRQKLSNLADFFC
jgi:hypothetical protein